MGLSAKLNTSIFRNGEKVALSVTTGRKARLMIFNVTADDKVVMLAPNSYDKVNVRPARELFPHVLPLGTKGIGMDKNKPKTSRISNRDTLQPEYDFSKAVRGVTAKRYAEGTNVVVIPSDILDVYSVGL